MSEKENSAKRVLVVEDDLDIRESISELLTDVGYHVVSAGNGSEALELLKKGERPHLILLDLMMPVLDGFGFRQEQLKDSNWASIPVIVMSADGNVDTKQARIGAVSYIRKPLDIDRFLKAIGAVVEGVHE